jgi:secondary thiamine-phosphate synthase enzyme
VSGQQGFQDTGSQDTVTVDTAEPVHAVDITDTVRAALADPPLPARGMLLATVPHTTCALVVSEVDDALLRDLRRVVRDLLARFEPFEHTRNNNPNARAHITSSLFGTSMLLPIRGEALVLGTYQRMVLIELDGPKRRTVHLDVYPFPEQ